MRLSASALWTALIAGFTWGMVSAGASPAFAPAVSAATPSAVRSVAPAAPAVTPTPRPSVAAAAPSPSAAAITPSPSASTPTVDPTEFIVDEQWPADERGDGCAAPTWPEPAEAAQRVLVIGDSLIRHSRPELEAQLFAAGWAPTVRCWGAKGTDWGVGQVERARELGQLPDTVVVSLGTNDVWWLGIPMDVAVDQMMAALGSDRAVYWVNLWFDPASYDRLPDPVKVNKVLAAKAGEYPNLYVVDFAEAFRVARESGTGVGWTDGVHLNEAGRALRTELIVAALS